MFYLGLSPLPVTVTTSIIIFLVGDSYKPSFATVTGRGGQPKFYPIQLRDNLCASWGLGEKSVNQGEID